MREKFKEAVDELTEFSRLYAMLLISFNVFFSEELGIVHRGIQVGEGKVYYKVIPNNQLLVSVYNGQN